MTQAEYDEMPELSDADLARAVPGNGASLLATAPAPKQQVTLPLDADVLTDLLRGAGAGRHERVHERVNEVLQDWLRAQRRFED